MKSRLLPFCLVVLFVCGTIGFIYGIEIELSYESHMPVHATGDKKIRVTVGRREHRYVSIGDYNKYANAQLIKNYGAAIAACSIITGAYFQSEKRTKFPALMRKSARAANKGSANQ